MAAPAGGAVLWSEDMLRPPDSRVDLVHEVTYLPHEPAFSRPSYRSIDRHAGRLPKPPQQFCPGRIQRSACAKELVVGKRFRNGLACGVFTAFAPPAAASSASTAGEHVTAGLWRNLGPAIWAVMELLLLVRRRHACDAREEAEECEEQQEEPGRREDGGELRGSRGAKGGEEVGKTAN